MELIYRFIATICRTNGQSLVREKPESGQVGLFRDTVEILCTLPPVYLFLKWNIARPFCATVDKIGESEVDVVRVRAKFTNCRSRMHV